MYDTPGTRPSRTAESNHRPRWCVYIPSVHAVLAVSPAGSGVMVRRRLAASLGTGRRGSPSVSLKQSRSTSVILAARDRRASSCARLIYASWLRPAALVALRDPYEAGGAGRVANRAAYVGGALNPSACHGCESLDRTRNYYAVLFDPSWEVRPRNKSIRRTAA